MDCYKKIVFTGINDRNNEYKNIEKMKNNFCYLEIKDSNFESNLSKVSEFSDLVRLFQSFGLIKTKYATLFAKELVAHCMALQPMPAHLQAALQLFSVIRTSGLTDPVDRDKCTYEDFLKMNNCMKALSQSVIKAASDSYVDALDVHIAFYAQEMV